MNNQWFEFLRTDYLQGFPAQCGFEVTTIDFGRFETSLTIRPEHCQQDGFAHAGILSTMADHTAGYAAFTTVTSEFRILTVEFKINFFKPATGPKIVCRSSVLEGGKRLIVSESELFSVTEHQEKRVSKAVVTLMAVPAERLTAKTKST